ncbi:elongation of very long chain fatty acids protein F-like [Leptidea sinapis]|uniref:elongation of very long chain fatty acids protein F-like n=1 Tax=Leptidea sinapis TaxID=189913 RepID=UPI00213961FC|nr:elongation of very long chain fatty acids protein F-like [Leptidea sinapis]
MDTKFETIIKERDNLKEILRDPLATWSFGETSLGLFCVLFVYLDLVLKILPAYMKDREPYKLKRLLTLYNAFQVAFSGYVVILYAKYIYQHGIITTRCPKGDDLKAVISDIKPYFIAKHIDLLDTVFFILRKKQDQVSFLHIYHHSAMVAWTWYHYLYHPCDHFVVVGLINSLVHVALYAYYGLSSLGPEYSKYTWWKKHLTKVQLIQFMLVISNLYYQQKLTPCPIPAEFHYFCTFLIASFFCLFLNFYFRRYGNRKILEKINPESSLHTS